MVQIPSSFNMFSQIQDFYSQLPISPGLILLGALVLYHTFRAIYLIYLSPLSIFPGSKWAALGE